MPASEIKADKKEVLRYLGYRGNTPDSVTDKLLDECIALAEKIIRPNAIHGVFDIIEKDGILSAGGLIPLSGKDISAHLKGAKKCIVMAATLGAEAERQSAIFQKSDMTKAVIFDSVCDSLIEVYCDSFCDEISKTFRQDKLYINSRFSSGYGDFPIEAQKDIISALNCTKLIGLTVTDSFILLPRKSVTAVMGIFSSPPVGKARGCESCNMKDKCKMRGKNECSKQTDFTY